MSEPEGEVLHEWETSGSKFRLVRDVSIEYEPYCFVIERYNRESCYWWPLQPRDGLPEFANLATTVKALREENEQLKRKIVELIGGTFASVPAVSAEEGGHE